MQLNILESFLSAPLESFAPSAQLSSTVIANSLGHKFPLARLRTFAITAADYSSVEDDYDYVERVFILAKLYARQIEELFIYVIGSVDQPVSHLSGGNFSNLRSLCFSWGRDSDLLVLKAIGSSLLTLGKLSFGFQPSTIATGWVYNGMMGKYPLHDDIIAAILPLENLVRLTAFGDEYIADWCGSDWAWHRFFKEHVWFNQGRSYHYSEGHESNYADGIWATTGYVEQDLMPWVVGWIGHQHPPSAVLEIAGRYAAALPSLRGFVCGRVRVEIARRKQS